MSTSEMILLKFSDGVTSKMAHFPSHHKEVRGVLVVFPAMGVKGSYYRNAAQHFAAKGFHAFTIDHRGHGSSSVIPARDINYGYKEQMETEYVQMLEYVRKRYPALKVVVVGHSLGGQMGSMFIARYIELTDGIILNASCSPYYRGWGRLGRGLWVFTWLIRLMSFVVGYYPGKQIGFGGKESRGLIIDWCQTVLTNHFKARNSSFDYEVAMRGSVKPVLGITYEGDSSAPPEALQNLTCKFVSANVTLKHLSPEPGQKKYNHYSWVRVPMICDKVIEDWWESSFG